MGMGDREIKCMKQDKYAEKFVNYIRGAKNKSALVEIINKIYEEGYEDGFNDTENHNPTK